MAEKHKIFMLVGVVLTLACSSGRRITVEMSSAEGLTSGDVVVMAGLPIGRVSTVTVRGGVAVVNAVLGEVDSLPSGREIVFLLDQYGNRKCLRAYDIGPLAQMRGRPPDSYRGTASEVELTLWRVRGKLEDWWHTAR